MRFIIYGAGGIGGTIGARLFQQGYEVGLIARGAHFETLRDEGMRFISPTQDVRLKIPVFDHPGDADIGSQDVVILAVKSQHTEVALRELYEVAGDEPPVVCAQNGVVNERIALRRARHVYGMVVYLGGQHLVPGEIVNSSEGPAGILDLGRYPIGVDDTVEAVAKALEASGISSSPDPVIMRQKYWKLLGNLGNSLQAACDQPSPEISTMLRQEAVECYRAAGIDWASNEEMRPRLDRLANSLRISDRERGGGSSWQSIKRGTGDIEADYLNGEIVQLGRLHGVATPANEVLQRLGNRLASERLPVGSFTPAEVMEMIEAQGG